MIDYTFCLNYKIIESCIEKMNFFLKTSVNFLIHCVPFRKKEYSGHMQQLSLSLFLKKNINSLQLGDIHWTLGFRSLIHSWMNFIMNPQSLSDLFKIKSKIIRLDAKCLCNEINVLMIAHGTTFFSGGFVNKHALTISQTTQRT